MISCASAPSTHTATADIKSDPLAINQSAWRYDSENGIYYQIGIPYGTSIQSPAYETLAIYVPEAYFDATANGDGTYTVKLNTTNTVNGYTSETAPILLPVNTGGYAAQLPPTEYSSSGLSTYMDAGYVYVFVGMRGRKPMFGESPDMGASGGAPWGITDLKAGIRYLRYNSDQIPGNEERMFTFGMSGGGAQSAVAGASGDSPLFTPYLEAIGAAMTDKEGNALSDATYGCMAWCPITTLGAGDMAYEWNMGQFSDTGVRAEGTYTKALSLDLAWLYPLYLNSLGLQDAEGNDLTLESSETDSGLAMSGSYYESLKRLVEESLEHWLIDTPFPYTVVDLGFEMDGGFGGGGNQGPAAGGKLQKASSTQSDLGLTYATKADYIASLNADGQWVTYDEESGKVTITSIADFVRHLKPATKNVGAFDDVGKGQGENELFGDGVAPVHFDQAIASLIEQHQDTYSQYADWDPTLPESYQKDMQLTDEEGNDVETRTNMMDPLYYLAPTSEGYQSSTPARYWRIRSGIEQGDTALTTEYNIALAAEMDPAIENVDFETIWNQKHRMAERTGTSTQNFIDWVESCMGK